MRKLSAALYFAIAAALVVSSACSKKGSPISPTSPDSNPPPSRQYETLPANHALKSDAGEETKMWAEMTSEPAPVRGSSIRLGYRNCADPKVQCPAVVVHLKIGFEGIDNPFVGALFKGYFSDDGVTPKWDSLFVLGVGKGNSLIPLLQLMNVTTIGKFLLIKGNHGGASTCNPPGHPDCSPFKDSPAEGKTSFELGYQPQ